MFLYQKQKLFSFLFNIAFDNEKLVEKYKMKRRFFYAINLKIKIFVRNR